MHTISEREFIRGNRDGSGGRNCSVNEIRWVGLLIIPILAACSPGAKLTPDPQARAELVVRVTDMATQTADPEALNAAVEALFAAGSEEAALELLRNVEEERASVLLRIARYTALRDREEESVGLVDEALGLASVDGDPVASAKALDALTIEASKVAATTGSAEILAYLLQLGRTQDLGAEAVAEIVIAACEIAVGSGDWDLLGQASLLKPALTEGEARDSALMALTWANAHRVSSDHEPDLINEGVLFADAISDKPRKAMAFALLAEAARKLRSDRLTMQMVEKMDAAMVGTGGSELIEGYCRVALGFRPGGDFAQRVLGQALKAAEQTSSFAGLGLPEKDAAEASGTFGWLTARYFSWIGRVAIELKEPTIAVPALRQATTLMAKVDPAAAMFLGVTVEPFLEAVEYLDDTEKQKTLLISVRDFANRIPDPIGRSAMLVSINDTAQRIAIAQEAPELRELAWHSVTLIPMPDWQKAQLPKLSYTSARLGDPGFVFKRLPDLCPVADPVLELKVLAAALKGLAESDQALTPGSSHFLAETHLTANS